MVPVEIPPRRHPLKVAVCRQAPWPDDKPPIRFDFQVHFEMKGEANEDSPYYNYDYDYYDPDDDYWDDDSDHDCEDSECED
jgi:hypothetical protein